MLILNLRIYFNYLPFLHQLLITCDRFIHKASTCIFNLFYCKKTFTVKVSWKYCQHLIIILNSRCLIYLPLEWLCSFTSLPSPPRLVSCVDIALTCPFCFFVKNACIKKPCPSNAICQAGFSSEGYRCVCVPGYTGEDCAEGEADIQVLAIT